MFIQNKYTRWYFSIIDRSQSRDEIESGELHHIIPRSIGGSDSNTNLVRLTFREHFICHLLLTKMVEGENRTKMYYALKFMTAKSKRMNSRSKLSSRSFETVRRLFAEARRQSVHSQESRKKTSLSMAGNTNKLGKKHSKETNDRIRAAMLGTKRMRLGDKKAYIHHTEIETRMKEGWVLGWS